MPDRQLRARVPEDLADAVDKIVDNINDDVPGAGASVSSILRYAIQDYINRYEGTRRRDTIFLEIPIEDLRYEELNKVTDLLIDLETIIEDNSIETVSNERKTKFVKACGKASDLLLQKTANIDITKDMRKSIKKEND